MEKIVQKFSELTITDDITQYTCPICLNLTIEPVTTSCKHTFCNICLGELIEMSASDNEFKCPMCRNSFNIALELKINKILENALKNKFPNEFAIRKQALIDYHKSQENILKIKILYGNTHKIVEDPKVSRKNPNLTNKHRWSCFVKVVGDDTSKFIRKVVFGLHPTFGTTEVQVKKFPFQITYTGWGTFEIPIKIYWHCNLKIKQPLELSHDLSFENTGQTKVYIFKYNK